MFNKDVVGCFCHGSVKAVDQSVYFGVLIFKDEEWSKLSSYRCSKNFFDVGVLEFGECKGKKRITFEQRYGLNKFYCWKLAWTWWFDVCSSGPGAIVWKSFQF